MSFIWIKMVTIAELAARKPSKVFYDNLVLNLHNIFMVLNNRVFCNFISRHAFSFIYIYLFIYRWKKYIFCYRVLHNYDTLPVHVSWTIIYGAWPNFSFNYFRFLSGPIETLSLLAIYSSSVCCGFKDFKYLYFLNIFL